MAADRRDVCNMQNARCKFCKIQVHRLLQNIDAHICINYVDQLNPELTKDANMRWKLCVSDILKYFAIEEKEAPTF